jgi:hypothetical protein
MQSPASDSRTAWAAVAISLLVGCHRAPTGVVELTWTIPSKNVDGTPLTDLAGYHIHYGRSPDSLKLSLVIRDPSATRYTITRLAPGTWYFRLTSTNSAGAESAMTPAVSYTVR